ncbi:MAG TPA: SDR family NAD-dependent epimerase/dehydratase, partial [Casimicrobiaceae bacterium]|nr:SDR family NAD-dependent epimerase/dehydratase [Casimicrobiaceae bacterium]
RLMESPPEVTGPINLGNPYELTIAEIARTIVELTGSKSKIVFEPLPEDDPRQRRPDITQAKRVLGWEPKTPLETGLRKTIEYFRKIVQRGRRHTPAPRPA